MSGMWRSHDHQSGWAILTGNVPNGCVTLVTHGT